MTTFEDLGLVAPLLRGVEEQGYTTPTPIQEQAIPLLLAERDVLGCAQTGTGKTAAFSLPILQHLHEDPTEGRRYIRCLVMTPTRELAAQIEEAFINYGRFVDVRHKVIFGGVNQNPQVAALRAGFDVLVATPGRLLDLEGQGHVDLSGVEFFVLDEADRMLDMGFIHDIRRVLKLLPDDRQNLLFSATMPDSIVTLAGGFLHDPVKVEVTPQSSTVEAVEQKVMFVERGDKRHLLGDILEGPTVTRAIVFTRTKHGANRLTQQLCKRGIEAAAIHGNKSQNARKRALDGFREGRIVVLVATDIAARGIDVDDVSHVFNFDIPHEPEVYVHRIGRTGRAGRAGIAITLCEGGDQGDDLRQIERLIGQEIPQDTDHQYHAESCIPPVGGSGGGRRRRSGGGGGGGGRGGGGRGGGRGGNSRGGGGRGGRDGGRSRSQSSDRTDDRDRPAAKASDAGDAGTSDGEQRPQRRRRRRKPNPGTPVSASGGESRPATSEGGDAPKPRRRRRRRRRPSGDAPPQS